MNKDKIFNLVLGMFVLFIIILTLHFFHHYIEDSEFNAIVQKGFKTEEVLVSYHYKCPYCGHEDELPISNIKSFKNQEIHFITFTCAKCERDITISPMAQDNQTVDYSKFNQ